MSTNEENSVKHDPQRAGTTGGTPRTESMSQVTTSKLSPDSSTCTRSDSFFQEDSDYHPPHGCRRVPPPLPAPVKSSSTSHDSPKSAIVHPAVTGEPDIPPISPKSHADAPDLRRVAPNKTAPLGQSSSNPSESRNSHRSLTEDTVGTSRLERVNSRPPSPPTPPNTPADPVGSSWNGAPTLHFLSVSSSSSRTVTGRRSAVGPSWAVPPRVLLVDDDAVNRTLSSKFLQVYGCSIDVATDGFGAVDKMNGKKYDLVLMDIVMPGLDGLSATTIIRRFDNVTPIISMTSNSKPHEIVTYFSNGMNDILPKPFTKDGLLDMVEKHLVHLKAIRTMSPIPPESADTPLSNPGNIRNEATSTSSNTHTASSSSSTSISISFSYRKEDQIQSSFDQSRQDEEFAAILQNFTDRQRTLPSPRAMVPPSRRKHSLERDETTSEEKKAPKKRRTKSGDST